jgi:hypothetical protein
MTQIERRQARIHRICAKYPKSEQKMNEDVAVSPEAHHVIRKSQNFPEDIALFLRKNKGDPAVKVGLPIILYL